VLYLSSEKIKAKPGELEQSFTFPIAQSVTIPYQEAEVTPGFGIFGLILVLLVVNIRKRRNFNYLQKR